MNIKKINNNVFGTKKPCVLTIVMDGVGLAPAGEGNAVSLAKTPNLDRLMATYPMVSLQAHGIAVGLPSDDDMGNSEVGHNALGAGQVFAQGAKLVSTAIESGRIFNDKAWNEVTDNVKTNSSVLHFIGLFSDGNVHSNINHLKSMITQAKSEGVKKVRLHILLDGRDVGETSALDFLLPFEDFISELSDNNFDAKIASGGGRMNITMDRYQANWDMVKRGWETHVLGIGRQFSSAEEAITTYRKETGAIDQDLDSFIIAENGEPIGTINDDDSVVFFNFRGDRAIEISLAFESENFEFFDRVRTPKVVYAGMLEYDGDAHIPSRYLVNPPEISNTFGEYLAKAGEKQFAISETQKYGHVTYFWNGNRSGKFSADLEDYVEIPSDVVPFEQRPWMKCAEITDRLIDALKSGEYSFLRVNFPNGDMVGHTGVLRAAVISMEALDLCLGRILKVVDEVGAIAIITADHGNADEMYETDKKGVAKSNDDGTPKAKTAHTLNPVPCIFYDNFYADKYNVIKDGKYGLANIAATASTLMGYKPLELWEKSIVELK